MSYIELSSFVTRKSLEDAYRRVNTERQRGGETLANQGLRAAKARDPKLLKALESGAAILLRMSEEQAGVHGFDVGGLYVQHTEFSLWKNAYTMADQGNREGIKPYLWIYAMAGILAGVVT